MNTSCKPCICNCHEVASEAGRTETQRYLSQNKKRYHRAISNARSWLDGIEADPIALRKVGIKGKKKLVELLSAYVRLFRVAGPAEKAEIMKRVSAIMAVTYTPEYHNMLTIDDLHFKQDATSYLRAALLMEKLGMDTRMYREEIRKAHGRLNAHMEKRGSHQRMAFHWYYEHFGLEEPFDLAAGFEIGVIASRLEPYDYKKDLQVYHLTHEIFIPYEFGDKLESDYFSNEDKIYLRRVLDRLTVHYIMKNDPDITAELVSCIRYLRMTDSPVHREALDYLLETQQPDGKWGDYERYRERYGNFVDQGWYLHTTGVVINALSIAFHFKERDGNIQ